MLTTLLAVLALSTASDDAAQTQDSVHPAGPILQLGAGDDAAAATENSTIDEPAQPAPGTVLNTASEYAAFHEVIADLAEAPIGSGEDLDDAMDRLTAFYGEDRLARAWLAYAAMIASQHPEYLDDVQEVADYYGAQAAASGLLYDPAYATSFTHAREAQGSVIEAIVTDTSQIRSVSDRYRSAAYELQTERWANTRARDRQDRLSSLVNADAREINVSTSVFASIESSIDRRSGASSMFASATPTIVAAPSGPELNLTVGQTAQAPDRARLGRILSVAALQSLSDDPVVSEAAIDALLSDPAVERCLAWVRLDLQQCVAAGYFKYEDSFCIAEHALLDVSRCLGASSADAAH